MEKSTKISGKSPFSNLAHISVIVDNMEAAISFYESMGIGPFEAPSNHEFSKKFYKDKPLKSSLIIREVSLGPVVLQLVQHINGDCVAKECLGRKGPGVYHLGFLVDDVNMEQERLEAAGIKVLQSGRRDDNSGYAYFDTENQAGVILEIKQFPDSR